MEKEENKIITLQDLIEVANKYTTGKINDVDFRVFVLGIPVRAYIPLVEKINMTLNIVKHIIEMPNALYELSIAEMYKLMFFKVLLGQYAMIDISDESLLTYENYDLLYPVFYAIFIENCKDDYSVYESIIDRTLSVYNFNGLLEVISCIDEDRLNKAAKENTAALQELQENTEVIKELNKIFEYNDPLTKEIVDSIETLGASETNQKFAQKKRGRKKKIS